MNRTICLAGLITIALGVAASRADEPTVVKDQEQKNREASTWIDPARAAAEDFDFLVQGEYGVDKPNTAWGVQVVALGGGTFDAYLLEGGLPGLGWTKNKSRTRVSGKQIGESIQFASEDGKTTAVIRDGTISVSESGKVLGRLPRLERQSPTLGAMPSAGAIVLFDGSSADAWTGGVIENGLLQNSNAVTKELFEDYTLHLEFRTPYKPFARGQQRGNSGVYHQSRYETQILDSFGLEGQMNETGGIYSIAAPTLNMCFPPLTWQTYDIEFTAARFDTEGKVTKHARITVNLNGVVVHADQDLPQTTPAARIKKITPAAGPLYLQHHNNPIYYRNIWIVPKKISDAR